MARCCPPQHNFEFPIQALIAWPTAGESVAPGSITVDEAKTMVQQHRAIILVQDKEYQVLRNRKGLDRAANCLNAACSTADAAKIRAAIDRLQSLECITGARTLSFQGVCVEGLQFKDAVCISSC